MSMHKGKKMKKLVALLLTAAMTVAMTVGCGGSGGSSDSSEGSSSSASTSSTNENVTGEAVQKDVVNIGIEADPSDLSPFGPETTGRTAILDCLYETLGYFEDGEFVGVLAKDYELSEDQTTLTFNLYEDIYDQAGNHMTASDVVFSYNSKVEAGNFFNIDFINDVEAVDDYTVQFNLTPPLNVTNIANLVHYLFCVTEEAYNASADGMVTDGIVSTSHYKVADYQSGYLLTLEKNDDYWQKDESLIAERNQANVDTINYYILAESNQRTVALESGTIDMCWSVASTDLSKFTEGGEQADNYWVYESSDNLSTVLIYNQADGHLTQDENLRKAIGYSINGEVILQSIYDGHGAVNYDFSREASTGFNEDWKTQDNFYQYDVDTAKELVEQSDYQSGDTISLLVNSDTASTDMAALIQGFCSAAGITVEINSVDSAVVNTYFADSSAWDLYLTQSAAETYTVQSWLRHLDNRSSEAGVTTGFLADDTLQKLLVEATDIETSDQNTIDACHDYVAEHAIVRGIVNPYTCYVVPTDCQNVVLGCKAQILPGACTYVE